MKTNHMDEPSKQDKITDTLTQEGNSRGMYIYVYKCFKHTVFILLLLLTDCVDSRQPTANLLRLPMSYRIRQHPINNINNIVDFNIIDNITDNNIIDCYGLHYDNINTGFK